MAFTKIIPGVRTVDFYPPNFPVPNSMNAASANVNNRELASQSAGGNVGQVNALPALWWLGILIVFVIWRLYYEFA